MSVPVHVWETIGAAATSALGAGYWSRRSKGERDATSARDLAIAYGQLVEDLRKGQEDGRKHIHRQADEIAGLRDELRKLREARDAELNALRLELATVRDELRLERSENAALRERVASLEARRRSTDPAIS